MEKTYQPENLEQSWYQKWEHAGYFSPSFSGKPYCIMLPPPNVTGTLHMGHGFQVSLMDALIRYHRMRGFNTLWQVGTDHAGIATQMVVELQLNNEGSSRKALGRDKFVERVWQWKDQSDGTIKKQLRRMGASVDWTKERFSLDEGLDEAVKKVFITLYNEGLIYRGQRLVNWDPKLGTAISDLEVVNHEETGSLWYIRYPLVEQPTNFIIIATTRPETMLGDVAVAVNPDDERYNHLIGKKLLLPLVNREILIIADGSVDKEFGTGAVKITPAHDFNDYAMGERHSLPSLNILTPDAKINTNAPQKYQGLDRFEARKAIVADLVEADLIEKIEPHTLNVPRGERSGVVIEPYLTKQWFVNAKSLAKPAIEVVATKQVQFVPDNWTKIYYQWLENIQDWCISRQLWWGHRIPAWYDCEGNIYVGESEEAIRKAHHLAPDFSLEQDDDVLDTWFSSGLWPFATLGWPEDTRELTTFYPTNVLVTGFDIIFFWVARMIMLGLKFQQKIPFDTIYITGLIRDSEGQKMSKSKGNILDPIDLIDGIALDQLIVKRTQNLITGDAQRIAEVTAKEFPNGIPAYGTDSLRFTFYSLASTGRDIRFDLGRIEGNRNFCNKLWNAARFVLMNTENYDLTSKSEVKLSLPDKWIKSLLQKLIQKVHQSFQSYRFDLLSQSVYEFIWNEYCDWYLELSKPILYGSQDEATQQGTRLNLTEVLEQLLRITHPLMPFITEEIWQRVSKVLGLEASSIMVQPYPNYDTNEVDEESEADIEWLKKIVIAVRNIRGEMNIAPNKAISLLLSKGTSVDRQRIERMIDFIKPLTKSATITWTNEPPFAAATAIVDDLEIFIPMADLIDKNVEVSRLNKEIGKLEIDLDKSTSKLNNPNYLKKAPSEIVATEQQKASEMESTLIKLRERLRLVESL